MRYSAQTRTSLVVAFVALVGAGADGAPVLWRTEAQLTVDFGEPVEIHRFSDSRIFTFRQNDLAMLVQFLDGVSQRVVLTRSGATNAFSTVEIESLLRANATDKTWVRKDATHWELGTPAVATAFVFSFDTIRYHSDGTQNPETEHRLEFKTEAFDRGPTFKWIRELYSALVGPGRSGRLKHFRGTLEFQDMEDRHRETLRMAVIRDVDTVLAIPWSWPGHDGLAHLEPGKIYEITVRDEDIVDMDHPVVLLSDRVYKSYSETITDSEVYPPRSHPRRRENPSR